MVFVIFSYYKCKNQISLSKTSFGRWTSDGLQAFSRKVQNIATIGSWNQIEYTACRPSGMHLNSSENDWGNGICMILRANYLVKWQGGFRLYKRTGSKTQLPLCFALSLRRLVGRQMSISRDSSWRERGCVSPGGLEDNHHHQPHGVVVVIILRVLSLCVSCVRVLVL